jgi:hypothetical protein
MKTHFIISKFKLHLIAEKNGHDLEGRITAANIGTNGHHVQITVESKSKKKGRPKTIRM